MNLVFERIGVKISRLDDEVIIKTMYFLSKLPPNVLPFDLRFGLKSYKIGNISNSIEN